MDDTTSASATVGEEGSVFASVQVKQEPPGQSGYSGESAAQEASPSTAGTETDGDGARTIRKITVLDPLKLKLLSRQNHNRLLSGLNAAKAKAQPPAPKPPPATASSPSVSESTTTKAESTGDVTTSRDDAEPKESNSPLTSVRFLPSSTAAPKTGAGGGTTPFRRKKVVPVAIARKLAQKEKAKPEEKPTDNTPDLIPSMPPLVPSSSSPADKDALSIQSELVEQTLVQANTLESTSLVTPQVEQSVSSEEHTSTEPKTTAFRRIKPKVAICLNPSRPKKSILKKTSSSDALHPKGSNEPSKSFKDLVPEETIVLDDDEDDEARKKAVKVKNEEARRLRELEEKWKKAEEEIQTRREEIRRRVEEERKAEEEQHLIAAEEQRRRELEAKKQAEEAEQRKREEEHRRTQEEEKRKLREEEQRRIHEEEQRRIREEEQRRKREEEQRRMHEEEQRRMHEEEQRRILEDEQRKKQEQRKLEDQRMLAEQRNQEEQRKKEEQSKLEEQRKLQDQRTEEEHVKQTEEQRRNAEQKRLKEEQKNLSQESDKSAMTVRCVESDKSKMESRKSVKIPPEIWKRQLERMKNNPNRKHSLVTTSLPSVGNNLPQTQSIIMTDPVSVEKSAAVDQQEPVNVVASVSDQSGSEKMDEKPAAQVTNNPTKEIRRISRLPPNLAMKLMNCVALKKQEKTIPSAKSTTVEPVSSSSSSAAAAAVATAAAATAAAQVPVPERAATITRISSIPSNVENKLSEKQLQETMETKPVDKVEQAQSAVPETDPVKFGRAEKTESEEHSVIKENPAPASVKEIKRISLPPDIALKLLGAVNKNNLSFKSTPITKKTKDIVESITQPRNSKLETAGNCVQSAPVINTNEVTKNAPSSNAQGTNPPKEIRRVSQLPPKVAMRLVDSLKQKGITVPKLILKKDAPPVEPINTAASDPQLPSEPAMEIKIEPPEPSTKSKHKVEILSQVILPTASYNLEELLAGKSTEGFAPSGAMPLPLPIPRSRKPVAPVVNESVPTSDPTVSTSQDSFSLLNEIPVQAVSVPELPMEIPPLIGNDVAAEVTVTTENESLGTSVAHDESGRFIPESLVPQNTPVQYESPKSIPQRQDERIASTSQVTLVTPHNSPQTSHQYTTAYSSNSPQSVYRPTNIQTPIVIQQQGNIPSFPGQPVTYYAKVPNNAQRSPSQQASVTYHPQYTVISQPGMPHTRMVLNPASMQQAQRPRFPTTQFVLVRHATPIRGRIISQTQPQQEHQLPQQPRTHLAVPRTTYYQRMPVTDQLQPSVIVPTPRYVLPRQPYHQQITPPHRPQRPPHVNIVRDQNKAFQPVQQSSSATEFPAAKGSPQQQRVIPKIVIDSSYVEQQERSNSSTPNTPQPNSPCSEEIRNKLRDKLKSRMMQQKVKIECQSVESAPTPSVSTPSQTMPNPAACKAQAVTLPSTLPIRSSMVYLPQDFQQSRMKLAPSQPQQLKPSEPRVIKQYICQGKKIYLTKISVTKPASSADTSHQQQQVIPPQQYLQYQQPQMESGFHGFPQAVIKSDQRIFQKFSEVVQQLERRKKPEDAKEDVIQIQNVHKLPGKIRNRKPSVVTAVTTHGLEGETFIITELMEPSETAEPLTQTQSAEVKHNPPPRITKRRNTYVVDDSDGDIRVDQLPQVESTSQETDQEADKAKEQCEVKVKIENVEKEQTINEERSAFDRLVKEEESLESDSSQADEDLAREILALVEEERKSLRRSSSSAVKKVKKRKKRRKRRKKKKDSNEELMELLMKHVNQESLIADIVASQQKKLPVVEISDTDEDDDSYQTVYMHVPVKQEPNVTKDDVKESSCETDIGNDLEESETEDIFAEILKPFVEQTKQADKEGMAEETIATKTIEESEAKDVIPEHPAESLNNAPMEVSDAKVEDKLVTRDTRNELESTEIPEKLQTESNIEIEAEILAAETTIIACSSATVEKNVSAENVASVEEISVTVPKELEEQTISSERATEGCPSAESDPSAAAQSTTFTTTCDKTCDNSALPVKPPAKKAPTKRAPKRKLKPTLVSRSKSRKLDRPVAIQQVTVVEPENSIEDTIEDSSDPFSDREEPMPDIVESSPPANAEPENDLNVPEISGAVRELVNEWDSDEAVETVAQPLKKHASFDNNGNLPCRISKNNVLKRTALSKDPLLELSEKQKSAEELQETTEDTSTKALTTNIAKAVRVSVLKEDLIEKPSEPQEPTGEVVDKVQTPPRTEDTSQTVENILKDWDDSPVKQRKHNAPLVARVLLDKLSCGESPEQPNPVLQESQQPSESKVQHSGGEMNNTEDSEPERVVARIFMGGSDVAQSPSNYHISAPPQPTVDEIASPVTSAIERPGKIRKVEQYSPTSAESRTTRSKSAKQTSIKEWVQTSPAAEPAKSVPSKRKGLRGRALSVLFETPVEQNQKPAGRTLRSRTKSVFAEKAPQLDEEPKSQSDLRPVEQPVKEPSISGRTTEVSKEAGGTACAARKEQETKECSTEAPVPAPVIRNRVPILISSEDEDDAPLAKRRKVLRKRRYMMRQGNSIRDLNANKRLFRGGATQNNSLTADESCIGEGTTFIKTEPADVVDTPDYYSAPPPHPHESFAVTFPDNPSGRVLSVVTVHNNQVVHAQDFDAGSPLRNQHFERSVLQTAATSTPIAETPVVQDHVFATPEPISVPKRKRRTKAEMEQDRLAKLQKQQEKEERVKEPSVPKVEKSRGRQKSFAPLDVQDLDPNIREFVCASCSETVPRDKWDAHYAKHSGLTYRVNIDPAIELHDETTAVAIVTRFMKAHRQLTLYCDKCNTAKKSALGLVSHRPVCGLSPQEIEKSKIPCIHCGRKLMPVSMHCHLLGHCAVLKRKKLKESMEARQKEEASASVEPTMLNQRGVVKRLATARAERRIQNISFSELILPVTKDQVTEGCLASWRTQFRKAKVALCVYRTCSFTGTDEAEMRHHHEFCPSACELLECKNCKYQTENMDQIVKHIKSKHMDVLTVMAMNDSSGTDAKMTSESSDDDGVSGADENDDPFEPFIGNNVDKPKRRRVTTFLRNGKLPSREQFNEESDVYREMVIDEILELRLVKHDFHLTAREWTADFRQKHYSRLLFAALRPDLDVRFLTFNMVQEYIPNQMRSLRFTIRSTNLYQAPIQANEYADKWQQLEAFTGQASDKDAIFYCGGPIIALDWLTVPDGLNERQILAVACKKNFDDFYLADHIYPIKCLIQIWDVGYLDNKEVFSKKVENSKPILLYSIACDFGPIWALKFCPSGCYNSKDTGDDYERLGLLAAAGSDGNVHIFSLGRNYDHLISNSFRVVNMAPVLKLTLTLADDNCPSYETHSVVKLSWSKSKNHSILAGGYSNGTVAVWNLNSTSPLLMGTKDNIRALIPIHKVFVPDSCVTALDLHYTEDSRYLLVCNADRKVLVYDLNTGYMPMEICCLNARSKVTTACWNTHFPVIAMAFDDVYAIDRCALTFHQIREIGVRLHPLYTFTAEATHMSSSDHLSTHVIGTDGGDVLCHKPMAYIHGMGQKNPQLIKYVLTSTLSVKVTEELMDNSYGKFEKNYCLMFSDCDKNPARMDLKSLQVKTFRRALLHEYPGIRINQVQWNPNERSHLYYAIGYQAGFVRVRPFRWK